MAQGNNRRDNHHASRAARVGGDRADVLHAVGHAFQDGTPWIYSDGIQAARRTCLPAFDRAGSARRRIGRRRRQTSGNRLNAGRPADDLPTHGETIIQAIAGVVCALGTAEDPRAYGEEIARRICPNILPYQVGSPAVFGFAEWNGRSLTDNAPNVMFSLAVNSPVSVGIGKESVTSKPLKTFPYVPPAA